MHAVISVFCVEKRPYTIALKQVVGQNPVHDGKFKISMPLEYDHFFKRGVTQNDVLENLKELQ